MTEKIKQMPGKPYPLGVSFEGKTLNIAAVLRKKEECGILFYHKKSNEIIKLPFEEKHQVGDIYCVKISDFPYKQYDYNFYQDDEVIVDPYAKQIVGNEKWHPFSGGYDEKKKPKLRGSLQSFENPFAEDTPLMIPYHDSFIYCLHVRGFTKHASSKVKGKGTYKGIIEKIPYLKELGVTAVELMPAYEFLEDQVVKNSTMSMEYATRHFMDKNTDEATYVKFNYWGYQEGFYFSPKSSYSYSSNPVLEFQTLVHELHKNGMELIMQFYFPNEIQAAFILEILKYWVYTYHVDGFRLKGANVPLYLVVSEPMLTHTKLMYDDVPESILYANKKAPAYKNVAYCNDEFSSLCRRFLKGDNDCLYTYQLMNRTVPEKIGVVRSITNYYGFRLMDLVSYEQKHNEANGENNLDGVAYNHSWNCGAEGLTRKTNVNMLRMKQMKNALCMLFLAQGTPFLMAGDEFGKTQQGNNNPYNQDNEISWIDWKMSARQKELLEFTKALVLFRMENQVLHKNGNLQMTDIYQCGFPEISYHMEELWKTDFSDYQHHLGFLYTQKKENDLEFIYVCMNMHWNEHEFSLPLLKGGSDWEVCFATDKSKDSLQAGEKIMLHSKCEKNSILLKERSCMILKARVVQNDLEQKSYAL